MMEKCLEYFHIGPYYGGNQEAFSDHWMKLGGCALVTACDVCIYMDMYEGTRGLYPFDIRDLTPADYERFALRMKPYLRPRFGGIDKLGTYLEGFGGYLRDIGAQGIELRGLSGTESYETARAAVISRIGNGMPVPMLNLRHKDPEFSDYNWHWFIISGYEAQGEELRVKVVSYGEFVWFDFRRLWDTGLERKGGLILIEHRPL